MSNNIFNSTAPHNKETHSTSKANNINDNDEIIALKNNEIDEFDLQKRDFLIKTTTLLGTFGAACAIYPLLETFSPAVDTILESTIEVDLTNIKIGNTAVVKWRGKPVFIKHRTPEEIMASINADITKLKDPQADNERVNQGHPEWLIVIGVCTHLGCIPKNAKAGWFCPCHGSSYDASGRILAGPAPRNLDIPKYTFLSKNRIKIG